MPFKTLLWSIVRSYSTQPARSRLGKKALSLDHFLQRSRVLSLYREIIRGTRRIADPNTRVESRRYARDEFERHRDVTDLGHIRYLISTGKTEWQGMERYVDGMSNPRRDLLLQLQGARDEGDLSKTPMGLAWLPMVRLPTLSTVATFLAYRRPLLNGTPLPPLRMVQGFSYTRLC
ncbi:complex 1 protein [Colletotrichum salicis]|uniref:LYR motif-containing protein 2 n=1 Tax=Colletotrichum salicis TaxID=1209931 RepID=A0A135V005_9PEZI|nr:complex 1 protein [Colletotrichum salicis]